MVDGRSVDAIVRRFARHNYLSPSCVGPHVGASILDSGAGLPRLVPGGQHCFACIMVDGRGVDAIV